MIFDSVSISRELGGLLSSAAVADRLPHAIVIEGGSESDRLSLARIIARAQLCSGGENRPCGVCSDCKKALAGFHADIVEAVADTSGSDALKVDSIRDIRTKAYIYPNEARRKAFILHNMQFCNEQGQNALLKILEEPPEYVCFVLTCPASTVLLKTILSRCSVYSLGQQVSELSEKKQEEAALAAQRIAVALTSPNEFDLMRETGCFEKNNDLLALTLDSLELIIRDAAVLKKLPNAPALSGAEQQVRQLVRAFTLAELFSLKAAVGQLKESAALNGNNNLLITRLCSLLRSAVGK